MYFFSNSPVKCLLTKVVLPTAPSPIRTHLNVGTWACEYEQAMMSRRIRERKGEKETGNPFKSKRKCKGDSDMKTVCISLFNHVILPFSILLK